jgi:hypothetical protein
MAKVTFSGMLMAGKEWFMRRMLCFGSTFIACLNIWPGDYDEQRERT